MDGPMVHIQQGTVYSELQADEELTLFVADLLTFRVKNADYIQAVKDMRWDGYIRLFQHRHSLFPAGLTARVAETLEKARNCTVKIHEIDRYTGPALGPRLHGITLYDHQKAVADKAFASGRAIIKAATGSGKTEIASEIIRRIGLPTLWIVNKVSLMSQTAERLNERLGIPIGIIGSGKRTKGRVTVGTVQTLMNLDPSEFVNWEVLILDECHHTGSAFTWYTIALQCKNAMWRYGLSATPLTNDPLNDARLEGMTGQLIQEVQVDNKPFKLSVENLAAKGFLALPTIRLIRPNPESYMPYEEVRELVCPTWRENPRQLLRLGGKLFAKTYREGIIENHTRNKLFIKTMLKHCQAGEKALMLCSKLDHGEALLKLFKQMSTFPVWWLSGPDTDEYRKSVIRDFKKVEGGAALIASEIFREGIDIPEIDVLFLAGAGETEIGTIQHVGRALRKRKDKDRVLVYDSLDGNNGRKDYLWNHSQSRIATYRKEAWDIDQTSLVGE